MQKNAKLKALSAAFPHTVPIFAGFWFLSLAYGIMMNFMGFSFVYPMLMSMTIYGGSLEFVAASMLLSSFSPLTAFVTSLLIQARHIFYGISMLENLKGVSLFSGNHAVPELIGIAVTAILHFWKKQMLLSIAGGTVVYMLLIHFVFLA